MKMTLWWHDDDDGGVMALLRMHGEGSCGRHLGSTLAKVHLRCWFDVCASANHHDDGDDDDDEEEDDSGGGNV